MIERIIKELGFTKHQAARVFGVSYATVHAWITGLRSPSKRSLARVAEGLDAYSDAAAVQASRVREHLNRKV